MDNTSKQAVNEFAKLSWRERICYGAGDIAHNLIFGTIGSMMLFYRFLGPLGWNCCR